MVDFITQSGPASGATMTTFRVATDNGTPDGASGAAKSRAGGSATPAVNGAQPNGAATIPLSARKAAPLDLATVERRGHGAPNNLPPKQNRLFGLREAPTYRPTAEQFKDPVKYIQSIREEAQKYGIVKIVPPDSWNPTFAIDTERFHFRTRRQELNSVEGGTRANLNYLDQLAKFHKQHGHSLTRFPSVDKRPLDLYKLKKAVEKRGGFERVCKQKKWAEIGRDLGYSGKIMSSLSTSLKNSYQKWLHPYEEYLRLVKPGVQQMLEYEHGGPFTPSPAHSPMKKSLQGTPTANNTESPAMKASAALNATLQSESAPTVAPELPKPAMQSGFTPVNVGGFTAVNAHPPSKPSTQPSTPSSFAAVNVPSSIHRDVLESRTSTPLRNVGSPMLSADNTPDLRPSGIGSTPLSNGHQLNQLKRTLSQDAESSTNDDADEANGRRSKRLKKDAAPTVAGSHMTQPRQSTPGRSFPRVRAADERPGDRCENCGTDNDPSNILLCDSCDSGYHGYCLDPPIKGIPAYDWHCPRCLVGTGEFGFEEGGIYSLKQFQEKAHQFKQGHFANKMPFDPVTNAPKPVTEDDVEREFWHSVANVTETVEVEYGADIHSTTHGSGFPTIEKNPRDPYSTDPWNLTVLPYAPDSLFRHIKSDISGMTVPWLYVGMVFSTFCWHAEDHYTYSANYQHFGATKTWYGVPAEDTDKFEQAMREAVPELFESQPDLLFQLVTLLTPEQLLKAGVKVYAIDQRAGEFVITFPEAYHAGFNHGFNLNEAVNFAPSDWEPFGEHGVQRLKDYRRQPCFSHDELLLAAASRKDTTIKTARWLGPAMQRMRDREMRLRREFLEKHKAAKPHICRVDSGGNADASCELDFVIDDADVHEDELICAFCKCYGYLSRFYCRNTKKVLCLEHAGWFECCSDLPETDRYSGAKGQHTLIYRMPEDALTTLVEKIVDKASTPEAWESKMESLLAEGPRPQLKSLRALLHEGEKIDWELNGLQDLKDFVEKCQEVADEAVLYTTRKQQARRKAERPGRGRPSKSAIAEADEKEREYRNVENIQKLLNQAKDLGFDSPEITTLRERAESIVEYQTRARTALRDRPAEQSITRLDELLEEGKGFNVDLPELESLEKVVQQLRWLQEAQDFRIKPAPTLQEVSDLIKSGIEVGMPEHHPDLQFLQDKRTQGEFWEKKAKELMEVEHVHYQQLDAFSKQATNLPVTPETRAAMDAILKKQRDAQELIMSLYERSKNPDFTQRPKYMEVRNAMEGLNALNCKPAGTSDLEKEQKRHEDWMRRGKKLFGKANAPLHILHAHMKQVDERNRACFDLSDQPRMPVEPASREQSPAEGEEVDGSGSSRDVFCICRKPEAGMMIECELCHEWYHGKCLKIARGKVKEDDKYTCPICDYRVKIPRDATRPKLEDLQQWQDEVQGLPFQPEEEETLESLIEHGTKFRDYVARYINPMMSSPDELTTQRFYLRKLEGAEILLSNEINFFRQELHKWAPVAPTPPPILQVSLSTRKPRPTKQQKLMNQLGITNPDDLPQHLRTKAHQFKRKEGDAPKPPSPQPGSGEPSHTPPGEPRQSQGDTEYFNPPTTSAYNNSPTFATTAPLSFGGSTSIAPIDPGLFESSGPAGPTSPMQDPFKSSVSGNEMFGEAMEMGGGQAEEALAVTEGTNYEEYSRRSPRTAGLATPLSRASPLQSAQWRKSAVGTHNVVLNASSARYASWYAPWSWGNSAKSADASSVLPSNQVPIAEFSHRPASEFAQHAQSTVTTATPELAPATIEEPAVVDSTSSQANAVAENASAITEPKTLDGLLESDPIKDTLPTAEFDPTRLIDHAGQLKELGLDYGWGMTTLFEKCIETIYLQSGLGWAGSIMLAGVVVRCSTFFFQALSSDKMATMASLAPVTKPLQDKMEAAIARGDKQQADLYRMQQAEIMRPYVGGMASMGGFMFMQAWIGFSAFRFLRAMGELPVPGMDHDGFLWFTDLTSRDPYFILPAATSAIMYTVFKTGGETGVQNDVGQAAQRQKIFTGLAIFLGLVTSFQAAALQLYFLVSGVMGGLTGWMLRQNGFRRMIGIRTLPSKKSNELYTKVANGELKLNDIKGPDGRIRYQPPTPIRKAPTNRRQISGINIKPGVVIPAHLQAEAPKIDRNRPDRDVDFEEGAAGKPMMEKLDYYRRNYRLSYVWRRFSDSTEEWTRKMGYGGKKMSAEEAKRKRKAEEYEIERRRRFENRS